MFGNPNEALKAGDLELCGRFAAIQKQSGLNQTDFAKEWGFPRSTVSRVISGQEKLPSNWQVKIVGKGHINPVWLETGKGSMLVNTGTAAIVDEDDFSNTQGAAGSSYRHAAPGFPEKEIVRATELAYKALGASTATPTKMGWIVATIAEMLVRGRAEAEILEEVRPMARTLAGSGNPPAGNPSPNPSEPRR